MAQPQEKSKERRNSFREAVEKGNKKGYESIWFGQEEEAERQRQLQSRDGASPRKSPRPDHDSHTYVNESETRQKAEPQSEPNRKSSYLNRSQYENFPTNNSSSSLNPGDAGYEPVHFGQPSSFQQGQGMRPQRSSLTPPRQQLQTSPHRLQSVSLVNAAMSNVPKQPSPNRISSTPHKAVSNTSLNRFYNQPPPYKEPPQPSRGFSMENGGRKTSTTHHLPTQQQRWEMQQQQQFIQPPAQFGNNHNNHRFSSPVLEADSHNAYVNVQVTRRHSRETGKKWNTIFFA